MLFMKKDPQMPRADEALPGRDFKAKVTRIAWTTKNPQVPEPSYYEVELIVSNPDLALKEGLKATGFHSP